MFITLMVSVRLGIFIIFSSLANDALAQRAGRGHHGPPPEAYTVCENKNAGDRADFVSPHGDTVTGTCEQQGDRLVLHPDNPPDRREMNRPKTDSTNMRLQNP